MELIFVANLCKALAIYVHINILGSFWKENASKMIWSRLMTSIFIPILRL